MKVYRHGDILITQVDEIPEGAILKNDLILVRGELTGHAHSVETDNRAEIYEHPSGMFLKVYGSPARIVHEEHNTIFLEEGIYRVWRQREYHPDSYEKFVED